jgi:CPA1 family monovalent cation:H+ antiporter
MGVFELTSVLIVLAALFAYVNCRFIRLPTTIGIMLMSLAMSLLIVAAGGVAPPVRARVAEMVGGINFNETLLHGMLAFFLFAGALHLDIGDLWREWDAIAILSILGTAISTFLVGGLALVTFDGLGLGVPLGYCLLLGALISPTDPIAVLGIMRKVGAPKSLEVQMAGESLFNDGVGVVIFLAVLAAVTPGAQAMGAGQVTWLLVRQVVGGVALGFAEGVFVYSLMRRVDNYQVEVLLTLALAMGGYTLAEALHVSAPIAIVVAGLFIGNRGRAFAMSKTTEQHLDTFWELVDEMLNAVLFLLIGMQVVVMPFVARFVWAGLAMIGVTLLARWVSVGGLVTLMRVRRRFERGTVTILTWGGLRGGLSVAMALSIPSTPHNRYRNLIVAVTYCVVCFSVFGQGLSAAAVIRRVARPGERESDSAAAPRLLQRG